MWTEHRRLPLLPSLVMVCALGCAAGENGGDETRDLALAAMDSVTALGDSLAAAPPAEPPPAPAEKPRSTRRTPPPPPSVAAGTGMMLASLATLSSDDMQPGDAIEATVTEALLDGEGREVIPAGATAHGVVLNADAGDSVDVVSRMVLRFESVEFDGAVHLIDARTDSIGVRTAADGVNAGDAAKVGAGAVVGAVAGRLLGGNKTGTAVGAAAGTAAGVGIAVATKGDHLVLDEGAPIRIVFNSQFVRRPE